MRLLILLVLSVGFLFGAPSIVEIPLRVEYAYMKRVPGVMEFYWIGRIAAGQNQVVAIPESELNRFLQLAKDNGFTDARMGDFDYLPSQWSAVGETAKATVTIEHTDELRFWHNRDGIWITWDDEHPAPVTTLNGTEIAQWSLAEVPMSPNPMIARPR